MTREEKVVELLGGLDNLRAILQDPDKLTEKIATGLELLYADEMPIGVQKARTGDPHEWLCDRLEEISEDMS